MFQPPSQLVVAALVAGGMLQLDAIMHGRAAGVSPVGPERRDSPQQIETGTVTDIDGNTYRTVKIGSQWWMAENLRVTHDPAGNPIQSRIYANNESLLSVYGRLYTWDVAMNGATEPRAQGIAPDGWHIPSDEDWNTLFAFLGGESVAGGKLKEAGTEHWDAPNAGATNASGFAGRPGGGSNGRIFEGRGVGAHYWSSTERGHEAGIPTLHKDEAEVTFLQIPKVFLHSIRCVRDAEGE